MQCQIREVSAEILRSAARAADVLEFRVDLLGSLDHGNIVHQARCQGVSRKRERLLSEGLSSARLHDKLPTLQPVQTVLPCPTMNPSL